MGKGITCFISYKKEDDKYVTRIKKRLGEEKLDGKSLNEWIKSNDEEYIMQEIRKRFMNNTKVTIFLIGEHSSEKEGKDDKGNDKNYFIKKELQATLSEGKAYKRSGLLGVVLPSMRGKIIFEKFKCPKCGKKHRVIKLNDNNVIKEFSANYYLKSNKKDLCSENESYCVVASFADFMNTPEIFINRAYEKTKEPISKEVHWRDLRK